jgi:hypothetical protein
MLCSCNSESIDQNDFEFVLTADMRQFAGPEYQTSDYFLGVCEAIQKYGAGSFMISPGDIDPPWEVQATIQKVFGGEYLWIPIVGNHEQETPEEMVFLRNYTMHFDRLSSVRFGPKGAETTMYSFDFKDAHFAVLNEYYDGKSDIGTDGDIVDSTYSWLKNDLLKTDKSWIFVIGHEPAFPKPDGVTGRIRHLGDSLDQYPENRDRFWALLAENKVTAYFCGHSHNLSAYLIDGVYQIDVGHSRGIADTGAPSGFVKIFVSTESCRYEIYRLDFESGQYLLSTSLEFPTTQRSSQ